jgi:hypothetical protein
LKQGKLEEAMSGALRVVEVFEELGASEDAEGCMDLIREIEEAMGRQSTQDEGDPSGERKKTSFPAPANSFLSA